MAEEQKFLTLKRADLAELREDMENIKSYLFGIARCPRPSALVNFTEQNNDFAKVKALEICDRLDLYVNAEAVKYEHS